MLLPGQCFTKVPRLKTINIWSLLTGSSPRERLTSATTSQPSESQQVNTLPCQVLYGVPWMSPSAVYPLWLQGALLLEHLAVSDLGFDEVLLGGGQKKAFGVHGSDDVIPDWTSLAVISTHATRQVLLYHLQSFWTESLIELSLCWLNSKVSLGCFTSGGRHSLMIVSTFMCFLNSKCCQGRKHMKWKWRQIFHCILGQNIFFAHPLLPTGLAAARSAHAHCGDLNGLGSCRHYVMQKLPSQLEEDQLCQHACANT